MGFPIKNDHFEVLWGYHYFWKHPYDEFVSLGEPHGKKKELGKANQIQPLDLSRKKHHYITGVFSSFFTVKVSPPIFSATTDT